MRSAPSRPVPQKKWSKKALKAIRQGIRASLYGEVVTWNGGDQYRVSGEWFGYWAEAFERTNARKRRPA